MDAASENQSTVRKSLRIKKPTKIYDPSDIKESLPLPSTTTTQLATSSYIVKVDSPAEGVMCEQHAAAAANGTAGNGAGGNGAKVTKNKKDDSSLSKKVFHYKSIQKWTAQDVSNFFATYYPEMASTFLTNEIDGESLFLIRCSDITSLAKLTNVSSRQLYKLINTLKTKDEKKINKFLINSPNIKIL